MEVDLEQYMEVIPAPPIVLVSTLYGQVKNIAPFGMNMPISFHPPLYAISVGKERDTYKNIMETKEFVVAIPTSELAEQIDIIAKPFPREVSEFEEAGLTAVPSVVVRPYHVAECQSHIECVLEWAKDAGDHFLIVGKVVAASIRDDLGLKGLARSLLDPLYHDSVFGSVYVKKGAQVGTK